MFLPWSFSELKKIDSVKNCGCHGNKTGEILKKMKIFLSETMRPKATKFGMYLYQMGLYHVSSNYSPGVKFDPTPGVTSFTWDYIRKILEIFLYIAIKPRVTKFCMWPYLVGHYQKCPNDNPGVKSDPALGGNNFYMGLYRENFRNLPVPSHKA